MYDAFAFIEYATLAHYMMQWPSQMTKHCNRHFIDICEGIQAFMECIYFRLKFENI